MSKFRTRHVRIRAAAIMLAAAFAVVFHGAFALMAHPLQTCNEHGRDAVPAVHIAHGGAAGHDHTHQHAAAPDKAMAGHAGHAHGMGKTADHCCSTVAAATLPALQTGTLGEIAVSRVGLVRRVTGEGYLPPTPAKPPRPTYQS